MGSSGSGKFGTYHIGGGATDGVGGTGEIECPKLIENIQLEDVAISEFYTKHKALPVRQAGVQVRDKLYQGRLVVESIDTNDIIGNIPTQYNYLINCIKKGMYYVGNVISSGESPIPYAVVTLSA